jgi:hypothetical protein
MRSSLVCLALVVLTVSVATTAQASIDPACSEFLDGWYCAEHDPRDTSKLMPFDIEWVTGNPGGATAYSLNIDSYDIFEGEGVLNGVGGYGGAPGRYQLHFMVESNPRHRGREADIRVYFDGEYGRFYWTAHDLTQEGAFLASDYALRPSPTTISVVVPEDIFSYREEGIRHDIKFAALFTRRRIHNTDVVLEADRAPDTGFVEVDVFD